MKFSLESKTPFVPKIWAALLYFILFIIDFTLFGGRSMESLRFSFILQLEPDFYSHVSNFSISLMLCLVVGYINIMTTNKLKTTIFFSIFVVACNFVYEWFIPILNTPDKKDAFYGLAGTLVAFVYLVFYYFFGLKENPKYEQ